MNKIAGKIVLVLLFIAVFWGYLQYDLGRYFDLTWIKSQQAEFEGIYQKNPFKTLALFSLVYIASTMFSLPGATLLTLLSGALFGFFPGLLLVSFASSIGATLAFLSSRFLFYQWIQDRYAGPLEGFNEGIRTQGGFYLFSLRLVPLAPFFLVNLLMGLTPIRPLRFYLISQIGMLPGTAVYVFAGTELSQVESLAGILSPPIIGTFVALGLFPLAAKKSLGAIKIWRKHRGA